MEIQNVHPTDKTLMDFSILNIHHINANSIRSRTKQHCMADYLKSHKPDIVMISETKLNETFHPKFDDYNLYRNDRTTDGGGGTALLIRDHIKVEMLANPQNSRIECTAIKIPLANDKHISLIAAYMPNQSLTDDDLTNLLTHFGNHNIVLAGDLNAKHTSWHNNINNGNGTVLYNWAHDNLANFHVEFPDEPTCIRDNTTPSTIDGFIISCDIYNSCSEQIQTNDFFSDHRAIWLQLILETEIIAEEPSTVWCWERCNWDEFNTIVDRELNSLAIPINCNINKEQIDEFIDKLSIIFENALKETCPKVKVNRTRLMKLSQRSMALIKKKKNVRRKLFKHRNNANYFQFKITASAEIKLLNNMIWNSITEDYRSQFIRKIKSIDTRNPNVFREIQQISNYKRRMGLPNIMTNENESLLFRTDTEKANGFADQFASINSINTENENFEDFYVRVESEIDHWYEQNESKTIVEFSNTIQANDPYLNMRVNWNDPSIKFINHIDLKQIIDSRNNKKSTGSDGITNKMLKVLSPNSLIFLSILFNHIINLGYYPKKWCNGIVIPVQKKGKPKNKVSSYRPIQLLSNLSKILEKHISDTILKYNEKFRIFPKQQFAYQSGRSTTHPLAKLSHTIANNLNRNIDVPTMIVTLDFEKAFDLLWIKGLIWKCLNKFNFSSATAKILFNFMKNRTFQTIVNGRKSNMKEIDKGSPQGSSISAFAFLLYTSDFPEPSTENIETLRYADDVATIVSDPNVYRAERNLNEYLDNVVQYTKRFQLKLNKSKCELIYVLGRWKDIGAATRRKLKELQIKIEDVTLEPKDEMRYLGVLFNKQFQFRKHIDEQIKRATLAFHACIKLFKNRMLNCNVKSLMYKALIRSILSYGFVAWNSVNSYNMEKIRKFERVILRACTQLYRKENSLKFVNSSLVYKKSKCKRFDIFANECQQNFFKQLDLRSDEYLKEIGNCDNFEEMKELHYKTPSYMYHLAKRNILFDDSKLLYYNKNRHGNNAYVTAQ